MSKAFWADYRENFGINRPTQQLISNGLYIPGTNVDGGTAAGPGNLENAINVGGGPGGGDVIDFGTPVPVNYHETAQGPASHAHGMEYNSQVIQTLILSTEAKIVNNTMWTYTKRDTFNSDGYSEIMDPSWTLDNRSEFIVTKPLVTINTGAEEKYQSTRAYDDFFFEPVNVWDLSNPSLRGDINSYLSSAGAGGNPSSGLMLPRPSAHRLGKRSGRRCAMLPSVSLPVSPYAAASGISPMPTLSSTIQIMRRNTI